MVIHESQKNCMVVTKFATQKDGKIAYLIGYVPYSESKLYLDKKPTYSLIDVSAYDSISVGQVISISQIIEI